MWVCTTPQVSVFRLFQGRGGSGAEILLGVNFSGTVGSDRYSAYNWLDPLHRQVCWAHLERDFQAWVERGGESAVIGRMLLARLKQFFGFWHRVRDEVAGLLDIGTMLGHCETRHTCQNILKVKQALWTFGDREGVEPTNNAAERALRRGVIWRRRSYGTQSANGGLFVERILTTVVTLRQQKRDVLDYLETDCNAVNLGNPAPSLFLRVRGLSRHISYTN